MRLRTSRRDGFTLIEMTIVLGVIGSIIAAIFIVVYNARYRADVNAASDQLNQIIVNMKSYYSGRNVTFSSLNPPAVPAFSAATNTAYINAGVFPSDMVFSGIPNNQWNEMSATATAQIALAGTAGNPVQFVVEYNGLKQGPCTELLIHNSLPGTGLVKIVTQPANVTLSGTGLPVDPITAGTACTGGNNSVIDWYYNLGN